MVSATVASWPSPPPDIAAHATNGAAQTVLLVLIAGGVVTAFAVAVLMRQRFGTWIPLAVTAGATFSALIEPLPDAVANLWYYAPGQTTLYTAYGNHLPVWTWLSYTMYYGGFGMMLWYLIERGASRRRMAIICAPVAIYMGAGELFFMHVLHLYTYYGRGAFVLAHYPMWIPLLNTSIVVIIGAGMARLRRSVLVRDQVFPAFLLPSVAMVIGLLIEPMAVWTVIHGAHPSTALVYVATISAIVLALGAIFTALRTIPVDGFAPITPLEQAATARKRTPSHSTLVAQDS